MPSYDQSVYVMRLVGTKLIKIGVAVDPERRRQELERKYDNKAKFEICYFTNKHGLSIALEARLHRLLRPCQVRGIKYAGEEARELFLLSSDEAIKLVRLGFYHLLRKYHCRTERISWEESAKHLQVLKYEHELNSILDKPAKYKYKFQPWKSGLNSSLLVNNE